MAIKELYRELYPVRYYLFPPYFKFVRRYDAGDRGCAFTRQPHVSPHSLSVLLAGQICRLSLSEAPFFGEAVRQGKDAEEKAIASGMQRVDENTHLTLKDEVKPEMETDLPARPAAAAAGPSAAAAAASFSVKAEPAGTLQVASRDY